MNSFNNHHTLLNNQLTNNNSIKQKKKYPNVVFFLLQNDKEHQNLSLHIHYIFIPMIQAYTNFFNSFSIRCNCLLIRNRFEKETDLKCNDCLNNKNWFAISKEWGIACWRYSFFLCIRMEYCWNWSSFRWWIEWRNNLYQIEKRQIL